jgi:hypothetical protein
MSRNTEIADKLNAARDILGSIGKNIDLIQNYEDWSALKSMRNSIQQEIQVYNNKSLNYSENGSQIPKILCRYKNSSQSWNKK